MRSSEISKSSIRGAARGVDFFAADMRVTFFIFSAYYFPEAHQSTAIDRTSTEKQVVHQVQTSGSFGSEERRRLTEELIRWVGSLPRGDEFRATTDASRLRCFGLGESHG